MRELTWRFRRGRSEREEVFVERLPERIRSISPGPQDVEFLVRRRRVE